MQAAHFLRGTDFCCRKERAPEAPGNSTQDAASRAGREILTSAPAHLPSVSQEPPLLTPGIRTQLLFLSLSSGSPHQGCSGESLAPTFPWKGCSSGASRGWPIWWLDLAPPPGGSVLHTVTHQHFSYTVLFSDIAEVPGHVGLEPDVLPICCRLLDHGMSILSARCLPAHQSAPALATNPLFPKTNQLQPPQSTLLHPVFFRLYS